MDLNTHLPLSVKFFCVFSRFEYALKQSGFVKDGGGGYAAPDWAGFCHAAGPDYFHRLSHRVRICDAVRYLAQRPPLIEHYERVGQENRVRWDDNPRTPQPINTLLRLTLAIRAVRNNLFHGGKEIAGVTEERIRDSKLINASLMLIEAFLEDFEPIRRAFHDDYGQYPWEAVMHRIDNWGR